MNFAVIGCGGFVAPRHLNAIRDTHNSLVAAVDPHDSVGILDRYSMKCHYFGEIERFSRHLRKVSRGPADNRIDWVSICSPNYLHDSHIDLAVHGGANVICEKPLVISPWNLDALELLEQETGRKIYTVLQLRLHPALMKLKESLGHETHQVSLMYLTSRGPWYEYSWKGDPQKSGGIPMNIGIHLFDLLIWLFGGVQKSTVDFHNNIKASGSLVLQRAAVEWWLSIDPADLRDKNLTTYRALVVDGKTIEFSDGFTDLHTAVYQETLKGRGFGIQETRKSVELAYNIGVTFPNGEWTLC